MDRQLDSPTAAPPGVGDLWLCSSPLRQYNSENIATYCVIVAGTSRGKQKKIRAAVAFVNYTIFTAIIDSFTSS